MIHDNRGQASIELLLVAGIAIVIATTTAVIIKGVFSQVQPDVVAQTNTVINDIS